MGQRNTGTHRAAEDTLRTRVERTKEDELALLLETELSSSEDEQGSVKRWLEILEAYASFLICLA